MIRSFLLNLRKKLFIFREKTCLYAVGAAIQFLTKSIVRPMVFTETNRQRQISKYAQNYNKIKNGYY